MSDLSIEARIRERYFMDIAGQFNFCGVPVSEGTYELLPVSSKQNNHAFRIFYDESNTTFYCVDEPHKNSGIGLPIHSCNCHSINALRNPKELSEALRLFLNYK
jgi:hypothetical protein